MITCMTAASNRSYSTRWCCDKHTLLTEHCRRDRRGEARVWLFCLLHVFQWRNSPAHIKGPNLDLRLSQNLGLKECAAIFSRLHIVHLLQCCSPNTSSISHNFVDSLFRFIIFIVYQIRWNFPVCTGFLEPDLLSRKPDCPRQESGKLMILNRLKARHHLVTVLAKNYLLE